MKCEDLVKTGYVGWCVLITQWSVKNTDLQQAAVSYNSAYNAHQRAFMKTVKAGEKEGQQRLLNPN